MELYRRVRARTGYEKRQYCRNISYKLPAGRRMERSWSIPELWGCRIRILSLGKRTGSWIWWRLLYTFWIWYHSLSSRRWKYYRSAGLQMEWRQLVRGSGFPSSARYLPWCLSHKQRRSRNPRFQGRDGPWWRIQRRWVKRQNIPS